MKFLNGIVFSIFIATNSFSQSASERRFTPCTGSMQVTAEELAQGQLKTSFFEKFSIVTSDIKKQGQTNYNLLRAKLLEKYPSPHLLKEAQDFARRLQNEFILQTSHSFSSAPSILRQGFIKSKDQLIREGLVDISSKEHQMTNALFDGVIGEQDVVYIAYEPLDPGGHYGFGDVTYVLDEATALESAYLTLNSFTVGAPVQMYTDSKNLSDPISCDKVAFSSATESYRSITFQGTQIYDLLELSALQYLAIKDKIKEAGSIFERANAIVEKYNTLADEAAARANEQKIPFVEPSFPEMANFDYCAALKMFSQKKECNIQDILEFSRRNILENLSDIYTYTSDSIALTMIHMFTLFPDTGTSSIPMLYRPAHWFWEVKIPEKISLDHISDIIVPTQTHIQSCGPGGCEVLTDNLNVSEVRTLINSYASQRKWTVTEEALSSGKIKFSFIKHNP